MPRSSASSRPKDDLLSTLVYKYGFVLEQSFGGRAGARRWRFDAARSDLMIAVEYDGIGVGHQSISGNWKDVEKQNEAVLCGWRLIRCNVASARSGECIRLIEDLIAIQGGRFGA